MNEEQFGTMWINFSATPPARILQVILEAVLQDQPDRVSYQGYSDISLESRRKRRSDNIVKLGMDKVGRMRGELKTV